MEENTLIENLFVEEILPEENLTNEVVTDTAIQAIIMNEELIINELQEIKEVSKCINSLVLVIALLVLIRWGYKKWIS